MSDSAKITEVCGTCGKPKIRTIMASTATATPCPECGWLETAPTNHAAVLQAAVRERCRLAARGEEKGRFEKHGTSQMYWKGRSEAAEAIRSLPLLDGMADRLLTETRLDEVRRGFHNHRELLPGETGNADCCYVCQRTVELEAALKKNK